VPYRRKKLTFAISPPDEFLLYFAAYENNFITDHFSDPGKVTGLIYVSICPDNNF